MGNNCCSGEADKKAQAESMQKRSKEIKQEMTNHTKSSNKQDQFKESYDIIQNKKKIENYLHELGAGAEGIQTIYNNLKAKDYENYKELCLYLTSSEPKITINHHLAKISKQFGLVDRYAMIVLQCFNVEDYVSLKYDPVATPLYLVPLFLSIYSRNIKVEDLGPLVVYLRQKSEKVQNVDQFVNVFKQEFLSYEKVLYRYFVEKLMNYNQNYYYFEHIPKSAILSAEHWVELQLKSASILKHSPKLLYSAEKDGTSFSVLTNKIVGYTGAWLLVISHIQKSILEQKKQLHIIGAYQNAPIQDIFQYQGNPDGFLFRLEPTLRYFTVSDGEGESNYFFISTSQSDVRGMKRGLGFGGVNKENCKLWIDQNVDGNSEVGGASDPTYGRGAMSDTQEKLQIKDIEIWGLGSEDNLKARDDYLMQKQKEATKARMVNKKELVEGGGAGLLFCSYLLNIEETFKHREQVVGEIENVFEKKQKSKEEKNREDNVKEGKERSIIDDLPEPSEKEKSEPDNTLVGVHTKKEKEDKQKK